MALFLLFESASGYSLFHAYGLDEIGQNTEAVRNSVLDLTRFGKVVKLVAFHPFSSALDALNQCNAVSEGLMTDELRNFLEMNLPKVKEGKKAKFSLGVAEPKVGSQIFEVTKIPCQSNEFVLELLRGVRLHFDRFIKDLKPSDLEKAQLGLGHSYSRAKVKFNVNRVDNMVIQAIFLLDTLDKDINSFSMRVRNLAVFVTDVKQWKHIAYCLSQLTFSEKGLKKLVGSFKAYEHSLCDDSVMDHFRSIVSKCKKFAKAEVRSCIEEFEEKLNKIHTAKKEQETTARNAQVHQQKVGSLEGFLIKEKSVVGNTSEDKNVSAKEGSPEAKDTISEESCLSSVMRECEADGMEVQSPQTFRRGVSKCSTRKVKGSATQDHKDNGSVRRRIRSTRR